VHDRIAGADAIPNQAMWLASEMLKTEKQTGGYELQVEQAT
jgi:hypothetical protein